VTPVWKSPREHALIGTRGGHAAGGRRRRSRRRLAPPNVSTPTTSDWPASRVSTRLRLLHPRRRDFIGRPGRRRKRRRRSSNGFSAFRRPASSSGSDQSSTSHQACVQGGGRHLRGGGRGGRQDLPPHRRASGYRRLRRRSLLGRGRRAADGRRMLVILRRWRPRAFPCADRTRVPRTLKQRRRLRRRSEGVQGVEFEADVSCWRWRRHARVPSDLKLSVHSGSDMFSI
jgi:hypothetical protein